MFKILLTNFLTLLQNLIYHLFVLLVHLIKDINNHFKVTIFKVMLLLILFALMFRALLVTLVLMGHDIIWYLFTITQNTFGFIPSKINLVSLAFSNISNILLKTVFKKQSNLSILTMVENLLPSNPSYYKTESVTTQVPYTHHNKMV